MTIIKIKQLVSSQFFAFLMSSIIFLIAAGFGWEKLHHDGLFTADEGWHMTEGWRLTAGDRLFKDTNEAIRLYYVLNAGIFKLCPDITLLGFRKLQYIFTMIALLLLSLALYKTIREYWFLPLIFSVFAVTGLFPWGHFPNLNYYTYPHFFLVIHLSFLLLGLHQKQLFNKRLFFVLSGIALWGSSFALLHTSVVILWPIFLFYLCKKSILKSFSFSFNDLCFVLSPFFTFWIIFISIYRETYILALIHSIQFEFSNSMYQRLKFANDFRDAIVLKYIVITSIYSIFSCYILKKLQPLLSISFLIVCSLIMWGVIQKIYFPKDMLFLGIPTWFASFFIVLLVILWFNVIKNYFIDKNYNTFEELCFILLIPSTILAGIQSIFSFNKYLMIMQSSIPLSAVISIYILFQTKIKNQPFLIKSLVLIFFLFPFYYSIAWYNFYCAPQKVFLYSNIDVEVSDGFGRNIKTDMVYNKFYSWIHSISKKNSNDRDFIISFVESPMVHMITNRRPSLATSWITFLFNHPSDFYAEELEVMKKNNRQPKLAFIYNHIVGNFPLPTENPVSSYIKENMVPLDAFQVNGEIVAICYIDRKAAKSIQAKR